MQLAKKPVGSRQNVILLNVNLEAAAKNSRPQTIIAKSPASAPAEASRFLQRGCAPTRQRQAMRSTCSERRRPARDGGRTASGRAAAVTRFRSPIYNKLHALSRCLVREIAIVGPSLLRHQHQQHNLYTWRATYAEGHDDDNVCRRLPAPARLRTPTWTRGAPRAVSSAQSNGF